jgi:hypothetical protein
MRVAAVIVAATTVVFGATPAAATPPAQSFTGGGTALVQRVPDQPQILDGTFTSAGQLGDGRFHVEISGADGFARFVRSDGMRVTGAAHDSTECGAVPPATLCIAADVAGAADVASAHVQLGVPPAGTSDGAFGSAPFLLRGTLSRSSSFGYVMVDTTGTTYAFGGVGHAGDSRGAPAVGVELTPSGDGYWTLHADGWIATAGDARFYGTIVPQNAAPTAAAAGVLFSSIAATPTGKGYWLFMPDGGVFAFGDARHYGDLAGVQLRAPIVGAAATSTGKGYWMVGADGGVFAFGDARFHGSLGGTALNRPVVGIVPSADDSGYWLAAADGGVFSFGVPFRGSMGAAPLDRPVVDAVRYGNGYLLVAADGGVFEFSSAPFFGSLPGRSISTGVVGAAATG